MRGLFHSVSVPGMERLAAHERIREQRGISVAYCAIRFRCRKKRNRLIFDERRDALVAPGPVIAAVFIPRKNDVTPFDFPRNVFQRNLERTGHVALRARKSYGESIEDDASRADEVIATHV